MIENPALTAYKAQVDSQAQEIILVTLPKKLSELGDFHQTKFNMQLINDYFAKQFAKCNLNNPNEEFYFMSKEKRIVKDGNMASRSDVELDFEDSEEEDDSDGLDDSLEEKRIRNHDCDLAKALSTSEAKGDGNEAHPVIIVKQPALIKVNPELMKLSEDVKLIAEDLIEKCKVVRDWIQLLIPTIEDGNTFGVEVQERVRKEVCSAITAFGEYLRQPFSYNELRGRYAMRIIRYPEVVSFKRAIIDLDRNQFYRLRGNVKDMQSRLAVMLDMITKNWTKINRPRSNNTESIY